MSDKISELEQEVAELEKFKREIAALLLCAKTPGARKQLDATIDAMSFAISQTELKIVFEKGQANLAAKKVMHEPVRPESAS